MDRFIKLKDVHGADCFVNISQIRAIRNSTPPLRGGASIVFDSGASLEVQESPERIICRCQNAAPVKQMEAAY